MFSCVCGMWSKVGEIDFRFVHALAWPKPAQSNEFKKKNKQMNGRRKKNWPLEVQENLKQKQNGSPFHLNGLQHSTCAYIVHRHLCGQHTAHSTNNVSSNRSFCLSFFYLIDPFSLHPNKTDRCILWIKSHTHTHEHVHVNTEMRNTAFSGSIRIPWLRVRCTKWQWQTHLAWGHIYYGSTWMQ